MMAAVVDTFVGKHIGRYEIRERIGVGGMARVYKAWDSNLQRAVAIKIMHEHLAGDATFKERFEREARLIAGLNHPNIVQVYDFDMVSQGNHTISSMVMPYIPGKTLKEVIEENQARGERLTREQVRDIMLDLCAALSYAHQRGMIHRDVKPGNILFDEHNRAVLSDFGIARLLEAANLTQEGATVGTPAYLSPEQAAGLPADARADLYALGVILYEMLAGEPPYSGDSSLSIILKHLNAPIPSIAERLSTHDPALDALIYKALAKTPENRCQTAQELADDLAQVFGSGSISPVKPAVPTLQLQDARTVTLETGALRPGRFSRLLILGGAAVVTIILLLLLLRPAGTRNQSGITPIQSMIGDESSYFISAFSPDDPYNAGWQQSDEGAVLRQITPDGFYRFENQLMNSAVTSLYAPDYTYADGTITLEGTLEDASQPASGYGVVFRYQNERNYHVFAVDGIGRYSLWALQDGDWRELRGEAEKWTRDEFINPRGSLNRLSITFIGDHFIGAVNDQVVADVTVDQAPGTGAVGIYLATTSSGSASLLVDTYQVSGDISSMTSEG